MINIFICRRCKKTKTHGRPDSRKRWVCIDCLNKEKKRREKWDGIGSE